MRLMLICQKNATFFWVGVDHMSEFPVCNTNYLSVLPFCIYVDNTKNMIYF